MDRVDRQIARQRDINVDGQINGQADRQMEKPIDRLHT